MLYGTTGGDDVSIQSTVFRIATDGTGFTNLHVFSRDPGGTSTNIDGTDLAAALIISDGSLYGTAAAGGIHGYGTVFKLNSDGGGFSVLHSFTSTTPLYPYSNIDGANPGKLAFSNDTLYGTAYSGGDYGYGTVFAMKINGTKFSTLHSFTEHGAAINNIDGEFPLGSLALDASALYGNANLGGNWGFGTIFRISLPGSAPTLAITRAAGNVMVTWPTNFAGFALQSSTNLASPTWTTVSTTPIATNGLNTVTIPISGYQQIYRLIR